MLAIHPNARTTPAVRTEIAPSQESSGVLASGYSDSTETSASGASAVPPIARIAQRDVIRCPGRRAKRSAPSFVGIPTEAGHRFRRVAGQCSNLMSATIPR